MKRKLPKRGDIWRDSRGPFLVLEEHKLAPWDKRVGYIFAIGILDLANGVITHYWAISNIMFDDMTFVA
jgi:hypothetical protein